MTKGKVLSEIELMIFHVYLVLGRMLDLPSKVFGQLHVVYVENKTTVTVVVAQMRD